MKLIIYDYNLEKEKRGGGGGIKGDRTVTSARNDKYPFKVMKMNETNKYYPIHLKFLKAHPTGPRVSLSGKLKGAFKTK